jgi:acetyltransferase-like isoleucine patch superfamily enzyme
MLKKLIVLVGSNKTKLRYAMKAGVKIGSGCTIVGNVDWGSEPYLIEIGNNVRIANSCLFVTHDGGMHVLRNKDQLPYADLFGKIKVGNNVLIGIRSIIMPGVTIGNNVVIGAGSVVTRNIPDNTVACGVPAHPIKTLDEYYEKAKVTSVPTNGMSAKDKRAYLIDMFGGK